MDTKPFLTALTSAIQHIAQSHGVTDVDVAYLGNELLRAGNRWRDAGFERLSLAIAQLEEQGIVKPVRDERGTLKVRLVSGAPAVEQTRATDVPAPESFKPLRPTVWFAFATKPKPGEKRYLNRRTGRTIFNAAAPEDSDSVLVEPVEEADQKQWAKDLVATRLAGADTSQVLSALDGEQWFRHFPQALEAKDVVLARAWSHRRSAGIISHVKLWASRHSVPIEILFATPKKSLAKHPTAPSISGSENELREILMGAISALPTAVLLDLPIPARALLKLARPDLLQ